jgi:hypothetical protein
MCPWAKKRVGLGAPSDLQPPPTFKPLSGYKESLFPPILFSAYSLIIYPFFYSIDISTAPQTTRSLYSNHKRRMKGNSLAKRGLKIKYYFQMPPHFKVRIFLTGHADLLFPFNHSP